MNASLPRIFVISLPQAHDRRESITRQLDEQGLDFEFIDAVYGKDLRTTEIERFNTTLLRSYRRPLAPNEIGCYLSHVNVYQRITKDEIPLALVLEDDALIKTDLKQLFSDIGKLQTPWELINIGSPPGKRSLTYVRERSGKFTLIEYPHKEVGAHAYLLTLQAARKLANDLQHPCRPLDVQWSFTWRNRIRGYYYLLPNPVWVADALPSAITDERDTINEQGSAVSAKFNPGYILSSAAISLHWKWLQWRARIRCWRGELERADDSLFP